MVNVLRINPNDNVAVALTDLAEGTVLVASEALADAELATRMAIPFGHKVALTAIAPGETVVKYGASIGRATAPIAPGEHVHVHNLRSVRGVVNA